MNDVRLTRSAQADLLNIWNYFAEIDENKAIDILDNLKARFAALLSFPGMGRRRDEISMGYRSFVAGRYVIYYRQVDGGIETIRVLHGAQDVKSAFAEDED